MTFEGHPFLDKEAPLDKLLSSLEKEEARKELEDLIATVSKADPNVTFQVTFPAQEVIPEPHPDFSTLTSKSEALVRDIKREIVQVAGLARQHLRRPIITDTFPDHGARRRWFMNPPLTPEVTERYMPFHQANKLRLNNFVSFESEARLIAVFLNSRRGVEWDKKEQVLKAIDLFPDTNDYDAMTDVKAKLEYQKKLDTFCRAFLAAIG